jgi:hypothetical protein
MVRKLFLEFPGRFSDRNGGYTRWGEGGSGGREEEKKRRRRGRKGFVCLCSIMMTMIV